MSACRSRCRSSSAAKAPGVKDGGHIEQSAHSVEIECLAIAIPEKLELRIGGLKLDEFVARQQHRAAAGRHAADRPGHGRSSIVHWPRTRPRKGEAGEIGRARDHRTQGGTKRKGRGGIASQRARARDCA